MRYAVPVLLAVLASGAIADQEDIRGFDIEQKTTMDPSYWPMPPAFFEEPPP